MLLKRAFYIFLFHVFYDELVGIVIVGFECRDASVVFFLMPLEYVVERLRLWNRWVDIKYIIYTYNVVIGKTCLANEE